RAKWDSVGLLRYPASMALYAMGMIAVETGRLGLLKRLFETPARLSQQRTNVAVTALPLCLLANLSWLQQLEGMSKRRAPLNDWVYAVMQEHISPLLADAFTFQILFDKFEILVALSCG